MEDRRGLDLFGTAALTGFALLLAVNQVVIKLTSGGLAPVFQAGLRSVLAVAVLGGWMLWRSRFETVSRDIVSWGIFSGFLFAFEFVCLYLAIDLTGVARVSVIFYSMPVWLALAAHFLLPGERLNAVRLTGLGLAVAGVALAMLYRGGSAGSVTGDLLALVAAWGWAAVALLLRLSPLRRVRPETQLLFQLAISAPIFLVLAPLFGDLMRAPLWHHWLGLGFQAVCVASLGFLAWFWLLTIYKAATVASFSFLSPVFAVILGWLVLGEQISWAVWAALVFVTAGITLINRK